MRENINFLKFFCWKGACRAFIKQNITYKYTVMVWEIKIDAKQLSKLPKIFIFLLFLSVFKPPT